MTRTVLGLKADRLPFGSSNSEEDDDDIFFGSSSDDDGFMIQIQAPPAQKQEQTAESPNLNMSAAPNESIDSFDDAYRAIASFVNQLKDYKQPVAFDGDVFFVPENVASDQLNDELKRLAKSEDRDDDFMIDYKDEHVNVVAQIEIVRFAKGKNNSDETWKNFLSENVDSRITAIIHFIMAKNNDKKKEAYHLIQALKDFIKAPSVAPISCLFADFNLKNIAKGICSDIIEFFPHNPLLESLVAKFEVIDPKICDMLALIPDDDDSDFSDSFIQSLQDVTQHNHVVLTLNNENFANPLENYQNDLSNVIAIAVREPPSMVTFKHDISDGNVELSPSQFKDWIISIGTLKKIAPLCSGGPIQFKKSKNQFRSSENFRSLPTTLQSGQDYVEATPEMLKRLLFGEMTPKDLIPYLPSSVQPNLFSLHYPLLHYINASSAVPQKRGFIYPALLGLEFEAHILLTGTNSNLNSPNDSNLIEPPSSNSSSENDPLQSVVDNLFKNVNVGKIDFKDIQPLEEKRNLPKKKFSSPESLVSLLSLIDIELILNGRSPLNLAYYTIRQSLPSFQYDLEWRAKALYALYTNDIFPPYISFRAAFALAINRSKTNLSLAASFLFEAIYIIVSSYPKMAKHDFTRNAILLFAEILEKLDRYYYSSFLIDVYFLTNPEDSKNSNSIALLCQRNHDVARAAFHFSLLLNRLVSELKTDEALYIAQLLSSLYTDYSCHNNAISILSFLLKNTYNFTIYSINRPLSDKDIPNKKLNSIQPRRPPRPKKSQGDLFKPNPELLNTVLAGTSLCDMLIKTDHFSIARELLNGLNETKGNSTFTKLLDYLSCKIWLKKNQFKEFLNKIPEIHLKPRHGSTSVKLSFLSAANFDSSLALVRLLINSYMVHKMFKMSLLWSEIYINAQNKMALKDVGLGFLSRGYSLFQIIRSIHCLKKPYNLHVELSQTISNIAEYKTQREFHNVSELVSEALASLMQAQLCLDKISSQRHLLFSLTTYTDLVLHYFFDSNLRSDISKSDSKELLSGKEPLIISSPKMELVDKGIPPYRDSAFDQYTLDSSNVFEELRKIFRQIDSIVTKCMNPLYIIQYQILFSKFHFMQNKIDNSKMFFDYAYTNLKKYFFCIDEFVCTDLSLNQMALLELTMENMCSLLFFYDKDFINDRLLVIDWLINIKLKLQQLLRVVVQDNPEPLESSLDISLATLKSMNSLYHEFFNTLENSKIKLLNSSKATPLTIGKYMSHINGNIRLFESGKISEEIMHSNNIALCNQIEQYMDEHRHANEQRIPIDTKYSYIEKTVPMAKGIIFMVHINDSIFIYNPSTGTKKQIIMNYSNDAPFTATSSKNVFHFTSNSSLLSPKLLEVISMFLMCDKKLYHDNYNARVSRKLCLEAKEALFGKTFDNLVEQWAHVADNHFFGENRIFGKGLKGALCSIIPSSSAYIFITSKDLSALPLELMFPDILVLRSLNYAKLLLQPTEEPKILKPTVGRWQADPDHLMNVSIKRSNEEIYEFLEAIGGGMPHVPFVSGQERNICFPFPLFSSNLANPYYSGKYPFCNFININVSDTTLPEMPTALFILTYSDFCELPLLLETLINKRPHDYYMFIPAQFVREAFSQMTLIFERHQRRMQYVESHKKEKNLEPHIALNEVPFNFATILQTTLIQSLDCPIALICPIFKAST